jgi:hypothetical protein
MLDVRRRGFIALLGGAAIAWHARAAVADVGDRIPQPHIAFDTNVDLLCA